MSLVPAFELGLWNAWILILPMISISLFGSRILNKRGSAEVSTLNRRMKTTSFLYSAITFLLYAYSVFLPLRTGTIWLIVGLLIYLPFVFFPILGLLNFASTPAGEPVTKGIYGISRNPMYVGDIFVNIGIGIACLSWVFLMVATANFLFYRYYIASVKEPFLEETFGETYSKYKNRTSRWIGIPKSVKRD